MTVRDFVKCGLRMACAAVLLAAVAIPAGAVTITIVNVDGPGEGFNDPTVVAPVGGNPGTTLGQQRLNVFQYGADIWGSILPGPVTILVQAKFDPIITAPPCNATSGVLGSAGPISLFRDFGGAPVAGTWYNVAEANQLAGFDLSAFDDIVATFNSDVDNAVCLGTADWYYGYDSNEGGDIELLAVVLHELGHGLGFSAQTNLTTGAFPGTPAFPTAYSRFILDLTTSKHWDIMTNGERVASAVNTGNVVWDGANVTAATPNFLAKEPRVTVNAPASIAGNYVGGQASFGAPLRIPGLTAPVVLAQDGIIGGMGGTVNDACEALTNAAAMAGNIALVDRGLCTFVSKAAIVQAAGAVGMIVVNNVAGVAPGMGGVDPSIVIPVVSLSQADGEALKDKVGLNCTITTHPTTLAGTDAANRLRLYAPSPVQTGSSISHWDNVAHPNLLMEPALGADLIGWVDITRQHFRDIGWFTGTSTIGVPERERIAVRLHSAPNPFGTSTAIHFELASPGAAQLDVFAVDGRHVRRLVGSDLQAGPHSVVWNGLDQRGGRAPAGVYLFRLSTADFTATGRTIRLD